MGSFTPARYRTSAPPAVLMWLMWVSSPYRFSAAVRCPPDTMVVAMEPATASSSFLVPIPKSSFSK